MGEEEKPDSPQLEKAVTPTAGQLADEGIANQAKVFNATLPQIGQLGQELTNIQGRLLPQVNQLNLEQRQIFGPALVGLALDMAKKADPQGFQLRQSLVDQVTRNLAQGGALTPEEQRLAQEDIRSGQVNRGFGTGMSDVYDEARFLGNQRFGREQARIGNALQTLSGANPGNAFMGITNQVGLGGTPDMSGFAGNMIPNVGQMMGFGQAQSAQAANQMNNWNAMNQDQFRWETANTRNPLKEDIMFGLEIGKGVGQIAGGIAGAAMGNPMAGMGALGGAGNLAGTIGQHGGTAGAMYQPFGGAAPMQSIRAQPYTGWVG